MNMIIIIGYLIGGVPANQNDLDPTVGITIIGGVTPALQQGETLPVTITPQGGNPILTVATQGQNGSWEIVIPANTLQPNKVHQITISDPRVNPVTIVTDFIKTK